MLIWKPFDSYCIDICFPQKDYFHLTNSIHCVITVSQPSHNCLNFVKWETLRINLKCQPWREVGWASEFYVRLCCLPYVLGNVRRAISRTLCIIPFRRLTGVGGGQQQTLKSACLSKWRGMKQNYKILSHQINKCIVNDTFDADFWPPDEMRKYLITQMWATDWILSNGKLWSQLVCQTNMLKI